MEKETLRQRGFIHVVGKHDHAAFAVRATQFEATADDCA